MITTVAGNKLAGGNVIQLAGGAGGVQRLTLVSPQGSHVPLSAASQRLILATGTQVILHVFCTYYLVYVLYMCFTA